MTNNLVVVVLDSLRHDSWLEAAPRALAELGGVERRWSYASWTAPSHTNLLMGLLPHGSPQRVYASEHYKEDYRRYSERLGIDGVEFKEMLPSIWLPDYLRKAGYSTHARVSMPVLNPATGVNRGFDTFELMPTHNDMAAMVDAVEFGERPSFWLLNVGETHYPYALADEDPSTWPRISGVHGVVKRLGDTDAADHSDLAWFTPRELEELRARQVRAVSHVDGVMARLFEKAPSNTWFVVTSDHGELFGEDDYFGHGPINHDKVLEVPFVEGIAP